jgi:methylglutaconyl-CoA hydratase
VKGQVLLCWGVFDELLVSNLEEGTKFFSGFDLINAMRKCSKIIVGRIHGKAVGGGVGKPRPAIMLSTIDSAIKLSELAIGLVHLLLSPR